MAHSRIGGFCRLAAFLPALLLAAPSGAVNLITNGSFESGPNPGAAIFLSPGSTALSGWTVTGAGIDYCGTRWTAVHGDRSLGLNGTGAGGIAQSFPTIPLAQYTVSFWLTGDPLSLPVIKTMRVSAAHRSADFSADITGMWEWDPGWNIHSWSFIADASVTTLQFTSLMSGDTGPALDSVFVALTSTAAVPPEPAVAFALAPPSPNPALQFSRIHFDLAAPTAVRLSVLDVSGREVALLAQGDRPAGRHEVTWDGRTTDGRAPAGIYFVALNAAGQRAVQRLIWLR